MKRISIFILLSALSLYINCKEKQAEQKPEIKPRYVSANGGINMRDKPDVSGVKIVTIPDGEKVNFLEETGSDVTISGKTGKWTKVNWGVQTGWVFGGFFHQPPSFPAGKRSLMQ